MGSVISFCCDVVDWVVGWTMWGLAMGMIFALVGYLLPVVLQSFVYKEQDLKKKYNAKWALVTGGSSGIGRSLSEKLAAQGLNVVVVALDDDLLHNFHQELTEKYPNQSFMKIPLDLSKVEESCAAIAEATGSIPIQIVFNNAGYLTFGLFSDIPLKRHLCNYNVNASISVAITHLMVERMIAAGLPGCICFTSSPAGQMPNPMASIYGGTKAFLTNFASSISCELRADKIDVMVMHPSPVDTRFYSKEVLASSSSLSFFKGTARTPDFIAANMIACVGRPLSVIVDQGYFSISLQLIRKFVDYHLMTIVMTSSTWMSGEFKEMRKKRLAKKE